MARPQWALGLLALVAVAVAWGRPLRAQTSMNSSAQVTFLALTIQPTQQLQFGAVIPGIPTTIDPQTSPNAGKFEIRGFPFAQFTFDLTLPTQLTTGVWSMPITFGPTAGCHRNRDQQNLCAYWDPATTLTRRIRFAFPPNATAFVWVGGTVSPSPTQFPGVYSAVLTATVAYTGN